MQLGIGQQQALAQKQTMSPQMFQQMKLLEFPVQELSTEIQKALDENPALEIDKFPKGDPDKKQKFLENITREETLQEYLLSQLKIQKVDKSLIDAAELLIQNLNSDGFNIVSPSEVAKEAPQETLERAIKLVQALDPQGTCTDGWKESLIVQAKLRNDAPDGIEDIIENHLEELDKSKYAASADFIKSLNPYPGRFFGSSRDQYVYPDLKITKKNGKFVVCLKNDDIPTLKISPSFENLEIKNRDEKRFVKEKIREANAFIDMLRTRDETILKLAGALIALQRDFFEKGPKYMVPLTYKDVAEQIDIHETTVSRIANGKYIQTDWGIYKISSFFPSMGESNIEIIKEIIKENKDRKLSDQQISEMLGAKGIRMARRTVSKYRRQI